MDRSSPLISVILPTHNRVQLLRRALASVLGQSYRNLEVIVIENACTDATAASLDRIGDSRLRRVVLTDKLNASSARNRGLALARGEFVAFQDDDDIWLWDKIEKQLGALARSSTDTVMCLCGHIRLLPNRIRSCSAPQDFAQLDFNNGLRIPQGIIATPAWLVRRDALTRAGGFDESLPARNDWELALRLSMLGPFAHLMEPLFVQDQSQATSMAHNQDAHCRALQRIEAIHGARWQNRPDVLAAHARTIAQYQLGLGDTRACRQWLRRSIRLEPLRPRTWFAYVLALLDRRLARLGLEAYRRVYAWLRS